MAKTSFLKVYEAGESGKLLITLQKIKWDPFKEQINGGQGELTVYIHRQWDDFDEGYIVKEDNRVELWISDDEIDSLKLYDGFISKFNTRVDGKKSTVKFICLPHASKMSGNTFRSGTTYLLKTAAVAGLGTQSDAENTAIEKIVRKLIDLFRANVTRPTINYTTGTIPAVGANLTYIFDDCDWIDVLEKCREFAPANFWWHIGANRLLQFKAKPTSATHTFVFEKHFKFVDTDKGMEPVRNKILFIKKNE